MFRFLFLAVTSAVISRCNGVDDPLVSLRENDDNSKPFSHRVYTDSKKLICYLRRGAMERSEIDRFTAEDVDPFLCTHVIFASALLDINKNSLHLPDTANLRSLVRRKQLNPNLKIMLSIGGLTEGFLNFLIMFRDNGKRTEFIQNVVKFLNDTSLDGVDIDWRYSIKRTPADRELYSLTIKEFREEFDKVAKQTTLPRYLLSITLPRIEYHIDNGYDLPAISSYVDFMSVLAFAYHDFAESRVDHYAPIYQQAQENGYQYAKKLTVNHTVSYLIEKGADARKLVLAIPTHGVTHTLKYIGDNALGALTKGPGKEGKITHQLGYLAYIEICRNFNDGEWTVVDDEKNATGAYAYSGSEWVSYDNMNSARLKAKFANERGLGGLAFFHIDLDDLNATCQNKTYFPIINAAKEEFLFGKSVMMRSALPANDSISCSPRSQNANEKAVNLMTTNLANPEPKMIVCVYNLAATDRLGMGKFTGEDVDPFLCTHVVATSAFVEVDLNSIVSIYKIPLYLEPLLEKKRYNPNLKVILSVNNPVLTNSSFADIFKDRIRRAEFIQNVVKYLADFSLDGIEIDWPNMAERTQANRENYASTIKELREEFDKIAKRTALPRYLLSIRLPNSEEPIDSGFDLPALSSYVDFMSVMTLLYDEYFEKLNHHAPLYYQQDENEYQYDKKLNINHTISYLIQKGADARKLILAVPTFGVALTLANFSDTRLGAHARGFGEPSGQTRLPGTLPYNELCRYINDGGWTVVNDKPNAMGPYAYSGYDWVSYDNMNSARLKAKFANEKGLGGLAFFLIDVDNFNGDCHNKTRFPLINAAKEEFIFGKSAKMRRMLSANGDLSSPLVCLPRSQNATERAVNPTTNLTMHVTPPTTTLYPTTHPTNSDVSNVDTGNGDAGQQDTSDMIANTDDSDEKNQTRQKTQSRRRYYFFFGPNTIHLYNVYNYLPMNKAENNSHKTTR